MPYHISGNLITWHQCPDQRSSSWGQALDVCIALLELRPVANEAYAPPPGAVGADTPLSQGELDAAVKAAAVQVSPCSYSHGAHMHISSAIGGHVKAAALQDSDR